MYKLDDASLSKLNIKTLKRYLKAYNISTLGMIEKPGTTDDDSGTDLTDIEEDTDATFFSRPDRADQGHPGE